VISHQIIPGQRFRTAEQALGEMVSHATHLRGAVAFVTASGAGLLKGLLTEHQPLQIAITARGAPITDPQALLTLRDAGAHVRIICGANAAAFHPKLWLARTPDELYVLSGSGNATAGGLSSNCEQFEYFAISLEETALVSAHEQRLDDFERLGIPLSDMLDTPYMAEWERQNKRHEAFDAETQVLETELATRAESGALDALLYADLNELYERTKAEVRIPSPSGGDRPYVASYFKRALERAREEGTLVPLVARMVKNPTDGLHRLAEAERPDLMVESVVLDASRPYHHRFNEATKRDAKANLEAIGGSD
jgi:HKD family nuclease